MTTFRTEYSGGTNCFVIFDYFLLLRLHSMQIPWLFPIFIFSLTFNKIPWLFPDFCQVWNLPDFSLTAGHPVLCNIFYWLRLNSVGSTGSTLVLVITCCLFSTKSFITWSNCAVNGCEKTNILSHLPINTAVGTYTSNIPRHSPKWLIHASLQSKWVQV